MRMKYQPSNKELEETINSKALSLKEIWMRERWQYLLIIECCLKDLTSNLG